MIPKGHWEIPSWISKDLMAESADMLTEKGVQYSKLESYHQMCRWNSGKFYEHPALKDIRWYWRVEPKVQYATCSAPISQHHNTDHYKQFLLRRRLRRVPLHGGQQQNLWLRHQHLRLA